MIKTHAVVEFWDGRRVRVPLSAVAPIDERHYHEAFDAIALHAAQGDAVGSRSGLN